MDNEKANQMYRPEIVSYINLYLQGRTEMERAILFQNVKKVVEELMQADVANPLIYHYLCLGVQGSRLFWKSDIAPRINDIIKMVQLVYPDLAQARKLSTQMVIYVGKMTANVRRESAINHLKTHHS